MITIKDGVLGGCGADGINYLMENAGVGHKIIINEYKNPDTNRIGYRFGTLEKVAKSKHGYFLIVSYNDECHHEGKKISSYSLKYIVDAIVHD